MTKLPTLLGNDPTFRRTIPLAKPLLPGFQVLTAEFEEILRNGILSKGQHVASLEDRDSALRGAAAHCLRHFQPAEGDTLAALREAERDMKEGRLVTNEQMKARIAEWTAN